MPTKKKAATKRKPAAKKTVVKKSTAKKPPAKKKEPAKKAATQKKTPMKKKTVTKKKTAAEKPAAKKQTSTKKPAVKKTEVKKKAPVKKTSDKKKVSTEKTVEKKKTPVKKPSVKVTAPAPAPKKAPSTKVAKGKLAVAESSAIEQAGIKPFQDDRDGDYMGQAMLEHFRNILVAYKAQLLEKMEGTVHHMKDDSANLPDLNDRATLEEEFSLELRARDRERKLVKKINESLQLIDEGEYGYCEACGVEIGVRRLEARPTATLCIDCKTIQEMKER